jgi:hypothetical protein
MTVKLTGAEFVAFCHDPAFDDAAFDEEALDNILVDGSRWDAETSVEDIRPEAPVVITGGHIVHCDTGAAIAPLETTVRKWRKRQATEIFTVSCDREAAPDVKAAVIAAGGRVVS